MFLNRPQLILERENYYLNEALKTEIESLKEIIIKIKNQKNTIPIIEAFITVIDTFVLCF